MGPNSCISPSVSRKVAVAPSSTTVQTIEEEDPDMMYLKLYPEGKWGKCMDGTQAGYYIRRGTDPTLFMLDLKGGGACFTTESCDDRVRKKKGGNHRWAPAMEGGNTLHADCKKNPRFCHATAIFVPYCTGDEHLGVREEAEPGSFGHRFQGRLNLSLLLDILIADYGLNQEGTMMLLTGSSAGAHGAYLNVDWIADYVPNTIVKAAPRVGKV